MPHRLNILGHKQKDDSTKFILTWDQPAAHIHTYIRHKHRYSAIQRSRAVFWHFKACAVGQWASRTPYRSGNFSGTVVRQVSLPRVSKGAKFFKARGSYPLILPTFDYKAIKFKMNVCTSVSTVYFQLVGCPRYASQENIFCPYTFGNLQNMCTRAGRNGVVLYSEM
jgi:hypothetical protein